MRLLLQKDACEIATMAMIDSLTSEIKKETHCKTNVGLHCQQCLAVNRLSFFHAKQLESMISNISHFLFPFGIVLSNDIPVCLTSPTMQNLPKCNIFFLPICSRDAIMVELKTLRQLTQTNWFEKGACSLHSAPLHRLLTTATEVAKPLPKMPLKITRVLRHVTVATS